MVQFYLGFYHEISQYNIVDIKNRFIWNGKFDKRLSFEHWTFLCWWRQYDAIQNEKQIAPLPIECNNDVHRTLYSHFFFLTYLLNHKLGFVINTTIKTTEIAAQNDRLCEWKITNKYNCRLNERYIISKVMQTCWCARMQRLRNYRIKLNRIFSVCKHWLTHSKIMFKCIGCWNNNKKKRAAMIFKFWHFKQDWHIEAIQNYCAPGIITFFSNSIHQNH